MKIEKNISLLNYNTFRVDVKTKYFVNINSIDDLKDYLSTDIFQDNRNFILGAGSNILFLKDFDGTVLKNNITGKKIIKEDEDFVYLEVGGGENRHSFVEWTVNNNYIGVENLVYIPGTVGASPVQNIGAYGLEVGELIDEVIGIGLEKSKDYKLKILKHRECKFGYRSSIFKTELKNKFFVTHVVFKLKKWKKDKNNLFNISYGGIAKKMAEMNIKEKDLTSSKLINIILEIRKQKLPDWHDIGTAGSFFKNPIISTEKYKKLKAKFPDLLGFEVLIGDKKQIKLSAGQLLQVCGWKGKNHGNVGTYKKHSLILVNNGGSGQEIADFASILQKCVLDTYDVILEPEVNYIE